MDPTKALSKAQRDKIAAVDFAGPDRTFPCDTRAHARAATRLYGHAANPDQVKRNIMRILKRKGWSDLIPAGWQTKKDVDMDTIVAWGGAVKAIGDDGKIAGYLVMFGDETQPDLSPHRDFFTRDTDYDINAGDTRSAYYAHGLDAQMGVKKLGTITVTDMAKDDVGIWVEAQLKMRDEYERAVYAMVKAGKLGWSSGAPAHLVTRKAITTDGGTVHEILSWPIAEGSLTPIPAEPRIQAIALKSLPEVIGLVPTDHTKALPSGMSYDDLRTLLQDELNEDFPDDDDDPGSWSRGLWIRDVYDDAVVYADEEDLFRRTYQVTAGNDIVWGPEESVVRVTTYVTATDVDDAAEGDAGIVMQKSIQTGVAPATMPFDQHIDTALAAVKGVIARGFAINELRIKSGRVLSASNHRRLKEMHTQMQTAHAAMGTHIATMQALLNETEPPAKKHAAVEQIYLRLLAREAEARGVVIEA